MPEFRVYCVMRKLFLTLFSTILALTAFAQKDQFAGFYEGEASGVKLQYPLGGMPDVTAEVFRYGDLYRIRIRADKFSRSEVYAQADGLKASDGKIEMKDAGANKINGVITPEAIELTCLSRGDVPTTMKFKRSEFKSPTLGAPAPAGSIVLFDGKDTSKWEISANGQPCNWTVTPEGSMIVKIDAKNADGKRLNSTIRTKEFFGPVRLHLEFKIPAMYDVASQARGNSGVFFGNYEVQVLDSFGSDGTWGDCGSVYRMYPPQFVASLEPEAWQTYDIEYTPAKFNNGKLTDLPELTVRLNGVIVQNKSKVFHSTSIGPRKATEFVHPQTGVQLSLQDHTNPVEFRNIWVQTL